MRFLFRSVRRLLFALVALALLGAAVVYAGANDIAGPLLITREGEQKVVFRFDEPVPPVRSPGISWWIGIPGIERVEAYRSRWLHADTKPLLVDTKDGEQLQVDNYVVWRIADPIAFRKTFRGSETVAGGRIDRIVLDNVREVMGRHTLEEVLTDRREGVTQEITGAVASALADGGIEVRDVRISRTELPSRTERSVFDRMRTERERLAKKSRAEGDEQARGIRAEADRDARVIVANARRDAEILKGQGDAEAARIYADAYGAEPEFYAFMRSLEAYRNTIDDKTTLIVSPDSEFFKYLEANGKRRSAGE